MVLIPLILLFIPLVYTMPEKQDMERNVRVLIITGGHDFNQPAFYNMFAEPGNIAFDTVSQPRANTLWNTSFPSKYDVLVFYDMSASITSAQRGAFRDMCRRGQPLLFLHHSLCSYQDWPEYREIAGGRYLLVPQNGQKPSRYRHDLELNVQIADPFHPVVQNIALEKEGFLILDEGYADIEILPGVHPLLTVSHPDCAPVVSWTHRFDNSTVVYIMLGHDEKAYDNLSYRRLLKNSIVWLASQRKPLSK